MALEFDFHFDKKKNSIKEVHITYEVHHTIKPEMMHLVVTRDMRATAEGKIFSE